MDKYLNTYNSKYLQNVTIDSLHKNICLIYKLIKRHLFFLHVPNLLTAVFNVRFLKTFQTDETVKLAEMDAAAVTTSHRTLEIIYTSWCSLFCYFDREKSQANKQHGAMLHDLLLDDGGVLLLNISGWDKTSAADNPSVSQSVFTIMESKSSNYCGLMPV